MQLRDEPFNVGQSENLMIHPGIKNNSCIQKENKCIYYFYPSPFKKYGLYEKKNCAPHNRKINYNDCHGLPFPSKSNGLPITHMLVILHLLYAKLSIPEVCYFTSLCIVNAEHIAIHNILVELY